MNLEMTFDRVHHIAYTVKDLDDYLPLFQNLLGQEPQNILSIEDAEYKVAVFDLGGILLEVQQPLDDPTEGSPGFEMKEFLNRQGDGLNHVAYEVEDLDEIMGELEKLDIEADPEGPVIAPSFPEYRILDLKEKSTKGIYFQLVDSKGK